MKAKQLHESLKQFLSLVIITLGIWIRDMSAIEMVVFQFEYKWSNFRNAIGNWTLFVQYSNGQNKKSALVFSISFNNLTFQMSGFQMIPEFERPAYGSSMYHYLITRYIHKFDWAKLKVIWHAALRLAFVKSGWKFIDRVKIGF